ncbi:MAG: hypothetical protein CMJ83_11650 [Planctomycetes bacterium]|nr:hypothetical protein [Planctomycetota bacterium]
MIRHTTLIAAFALLAGSLSAQAALVPNPLLLNRLLKIGTPGQQAWAAWTAGEYGSRASVPGLRGVLASPPEGEHRVLVIRAVLDACIRIQAQPTAEELRPWAKRFRAQTLVLAARDPQLHRDLLLEMVDRAYATDPEWLAAGNLLVANHAPGTAARLLGGLRTALTLRVVDDDRLGFGGAGAGGAFGDGRIDVPTDFPPTVFWKLVMQKTEHPVAPGRRPVFATRRVRTRKRLGIGSSRGSLDRQTVRLEHLATLLGAEPTEVDLATRYDRTIIWKGVQPFRAEARLHREKILDIWRSLVDRLTQAKLLSPADAGRLQPAIVVTVKDHRENPRVDLPKLTF